ncbi:MAG: cofactor-independent phosphoglycerate mutase [Candidatus Omnitrophica bacterium]|nr:cofactor-independent phosphoglycerate mutase [Candidatus Omnitrophota bacterium]MCF7877004.1 cofactor-independent phosphoglycerate mutase [Candidatus Omnitrophota bacterium]MCF7878345.1 cofactor-independent phosphoglycerate mutase [Candidatus Omnitrophota bacterium]MCF7893019.1 cofactor-independent phosphoglycerate mutase [Candidatus Omnitrophota bacterium]
MKHIIIVPDGAADKPIEELGGKTPLEAAETPNIDSLAKKGILGRVKTVPKGFIPASDIANLSLLGYDPEKHYSGRGPLEAANIGVELGENDLAFRCNFVTNADGKLFDYSAGHIRDKEAKILIDYLNKEIKTDELELFFGTSYRNLALFKNSKNLKLDKTKCFAPHDIIGKKISKHLPGGKNSNILREVMEASSAILPEHEINKVRIDLGENPANMVWLWSGGPKANMPLFKDLFGLDGAVISAVDLIKGIGKIVGLDVLEVEGANGYYDTNYAGKAQAAIDALKNLDFVFVHIEATDEAGHNQDLRMKIACLERIDKLVVGKIIKALEGQEYKILITPDHPTPLASRTHTSEPVPFLVSGSHFSQGDFSSYSEKSAQESSLYFDKGTELIRYFLSNS